MHADALKELELICDRVDRGELPEGVIPRLFWFGHTLVHHNETSTIDVVCGTCKRTWELEQYAIVDGAVKWLHIPWTCQCGSEDVFRIQSNVGHWRCIQCAGEWDSVDGQTCPMCGMVKEH